VSADHHRRVLVVIPAWNEQAALPGVLAELAGVVDAGAILVVNDGSTDNTSTVAHRAGVDVLDLPINLGVGGAMRAGYKYAQRQGYDVVVQLDADGQHDPQEIPLLLQALGAPGVDLVIGARFTGSSQYSAHGPRRWAMKLLSTMLSCVTRTRLTDTTSGFKASGPRAVALFATNYPAEYLGDTIESLVIAARAGLTVRQVSVNMRPRVAGSPSQGPVKSSVHLVRAVVALVMALLRPRITPLKRGLE
jgi:glycosyltransferase involved in cell wall biosynthesis